MITPGRLEQLALETLYGHREHVDGCFSFNVAGVELIGGPPEVASVIERILREVVEPVLADSTEVHRIFRIRQAFGPLGDRMPIRAPAFAGLDYLLGAYLIVTARSEPDRAVAFLQESSVALLAECLAAVRVFFNRKGRGYAFGIAPSEQLFAFVRQLTEHDDVTLRSLARVTLDSVVWRIAPAF
jgi:hypothetical protein